MQEAMLVLEIMECRHQSRLPIIVDAWHLQDGQKVTRFARGTINYHWYLCLHGDLTAEGNGPIMRWPGTMVDGAAAWRVLSHCCP